MDRFAAMLILLGLLVFAVLLLLALFTIAPVICCCLISLLYCLYLFMAYEESGVHHAQEFENRFWTIFAVLLSTSLLFAKDSPIAFGLWYSPTFGLLCVAISGYAMHLYDRHQHRIAISQSQGSAVLSRLRRSGHNSNSNSNINNNNNIGTTSDGTTNNTTNDDNNNNNIDNINNNMHHNHSLIQLQNMGIPVSAQLEKINSCLMEIDQLLIPSTINNFINQRFVLSKEREIITIFEECDARALNYLITHVKLGLLFYKIKDHNYFNGKNRTELINLLAVERLPILTVISRIILLHSLQLLKLRANPRAEDWVRNIILNTHQEELSELKTLTDAKGDYFCMNKLIYDDIRSQTVRQDILNHIRREAAIQQTHIMQMGTITAVNNLRAIRRHHHSINKKSYFYQSQWRKVLSDVDDTLCCSGGMYPAGIDKRYPKRSVYPGVLAFYRELDLGLNGPEEWQDDRVGNLVFLSARPHVYRDMSEKQNFAKFEKLRTVNTSDGRKGMHTMPSLLAGDLSSGREYLFTDDFEPLARKKFDNFRRYVSIYPEYQHVFVCDNGQGDVRAGEMMFDNFPYEFEGLYVHIVQDIDKTYGYNPARWREKEFKPCFFRTYPEAALHAASRNPPLIRVKSVQRICQESVKDFLHIKNWTNELMKTLRRQELNQAIWRCNDFLTWHLEDPVEFIPAEQKWDYGQKVRTPYGIGIVCGFDPYYDLYDIELDWRGLDIQVQEHQEEVKNASIKPRHHSAMTPRPTAAAALATVVETTEDEDVIGVTEGTSPAASSMTTVGNNKATDNNDQQSIHQPVEFPLPPPPATTSKEKQEVGEPSAERPGMDISSRSIEIQPCAAGESIVQPLSSNTSLSSNATTGANNQMNTDQRVPPEIALSDSELSQQPHNIVPATNRMDKRYRVRAQVSGRFLTKYSPPVMPKFDHKASRGSIFPFLSIKSDKKSQFKTGEKWSTPYGPAKIVEHREKQGIVVVDMIGWKARGYLKQDTLKRMPHSILGSLLRQLSGAEAAPPKSPPLEFPYAEGITIQTPFGKGVVTRPLPTPSKTRIDNSKSRVTTIGISLKSWTLANGKHPMLFSTLETTKLWKDSKTADRGVSIFSTIGTLVTSSRTLLEPFLVPATKPPVVEVEVPKVSHKRYYKDAAAVTTSYGDGRITRFRETDGFYEISLTQWKLANGLHPLVFLREDDISHRIAKGCLEGYPVYTSLGLSGWLASVEPTTGVHIVTISCAGIVCYLQPESVLRPLKAAKNEEVLTLYGNGKVVRYNPTRDMYTISLVWGAALYAKGDTFDRVVDNKIPDEVAGFGVDWLFRFFFRKTNTSSTGRSRSNSIVSTKSHGNRSVS